LAGKYFKQHTVKCQRGTAMTARTCSLAEWMRREMKKSEKSERNLQSRGAPSFKTAFFSSLTKKRRGSIWGKK
jgi:hypothetical protein